MPLFEYVCTVCGCEVERIQKSKDDYPRCPECTGFCDLVVSSISKTPNKWR